MIRCVIALAFLLGFAGKYGFYEDYDEQLIWVEVLVIIMNK